LTGRAGEILATDLSQGVLDKSRPASSASSSPARIAHSNAVKHFTQVGELCSSHADIRAMVQHRQLNLMQDFFSSGMFDVIFCAMS